jgi:hypothetical protein
MPAGLRDGGAADCVGDHGDPDVGPHARVAAGSPSRKGSGAGLPRRAVRACNRALQVQEREHSQRVPTKHRHAGGWPVPSKKVQRPHDERWGIPGYVRRRRRPANQSDGPGPTAATRSAAAAARRTNERRHHGSKEQEHGEFAAHLSRPDPLRHVDVHVQHRAAAWRRNAKRELARRPGERRSRHTSGHRSAWRRAPWGRASRRHTSRRRHASRRWRSGRSGVDGTAGLSATPTPATGRTWSWTVVSRLVFRRRPRSGGWIISRSSPAYACGVGPTTRFGEAPPQRA